MKKSNNFLNFLLLLLIANMSINVIAEPLDSEISIYSKDAEMVVNKYLSALANGEIDSIRNSLGGEFLERRSLQLSNPIYADKLRDLYRGAEFTLRGSELLDKSRMSVNVEIIYFNQHLAKIKFILVANNQNQFRIISENEIH